MKIFVAGGAGFIGSHFVERVINRADVTQILVFDNFCSGTRKHLTAVETHEKLKIVEGDIKNLEALTAAMQGARLVVHLAANADISKAITQPEIDFWGGTYLTHNVVEAMRLTGTKQILYTSGSGVYGENPEIAFAENYGPCIPISAYGASKIACEALISAYCHMFGIKGRAFRFANVVGPRQTHGVGYDFIRRLKEDQATLRILGDGTQTKSYIHVDDVMMAIEILWTELNENPMPFDLFNAATDDCISVTEIADVACEISGLRPEKVAYSYTGGDRGWTGDVPKVRFNVDKLKQLGWTAARSSRLAIADSMTAMLGELQKVSK